MAGPGGVLVGRGYVVIRPEFSGDWDRRIGGQTQRAGTRAGRLFGKAFSSGLSVLSGAVKTSLAGAGTAALATGLTNVTAAAVTASAVAVPALNALATAGAAVGVGLKGVGAAFKAFGTAAADSKAAAAGARQVESAQRALAKAQAGVGEAQASAARRVRDAQRTLADAQRDALDVQRELSGAYRDAARELEDYRLRLADAALDQEEAALRVADAERELVEARASGDQEAIARAELAARRARLSAKQQAADLARLQEDAAKANEAGVEGSEQVLAVKERIAEADRRVADAEQGLRDARVDGAREVRDAQAAVADAARALADAQSAAAAQTSKVDEALAKLTPSAREFVETVKELGPAWGEVRKATQESLFKGVAGSFREMSTQVIPDLRDGLSGAAQQINAMWRNWMAGVAQLSREGSLKKFFDGNTRTLETFARWPEEATRGWVQLSIAAQPALDQLTEKAAAASTRLSESMDKAFESGAMERAITGALDALRTLKAPLADIGTIFGNIFDALAGPGAQASSVFGVFLDKLAEVTSKPQVKQALTDLFSAFASITETVLDALIPLIEHGLPVLARGFEWLAQVLPQALGGLREFASIVVDKLAPPLAAAAQGTRDLFAAFASGQAAGTGEQASAMERFGAAARSFTGQAAEHVDTFFDAFRRGEGASTWFTAKPGLGGVFDRLGTAARSVTDLVTRALWPALMELGRAIAGFVIPVAESLARIWTDHVQHILQRAVIIVRDALMPVFRSLADVVRERITPALAFLGDKISGLLDALGPVIAVLDGVITWLVKLGAAIVGWLVPILIEFAGPVLGIVVTALGVVVQALTYAVQAVVLFGETVAWLWREAVEPAARGIAWVVNWLWTNGIKEPFASIDDSFRSLGSWAKDAYNTVAEWFGKMGSKIGEVLGGFEGAFQTAKDGVAKVWDGLKAVAAAPVEFVVNKVYNDGIAKVWNFIADAVDLPPLKEVSFAYASGGIYPGYTPGRDIGVAAVSGGEAIMRPEWTRSVGAGYVHAANAAARMGGTRGVERFLESYGAPYAGGYAFGGIIGDAVRGTVNKVKGLPGISIVLDELGEIVRGGLAKAAEQGLKPVKKLIDSLPGDDRWTELIKGVPKAGIDGFISWLRGEDGKARGQLGGLMMALPGAPGAALAAAMTQSGEPYVWGGTGPDGWDCSGLTQWAYRQAGYPLGRTTYDQVLQGTRIDMSQALPGDLVFEHFSGAFPSHVGLYASPGWIFNAPRTGDVVRFSPMQNVTEVRRVLDPSRLGTHDNGGWLRHGEAAINLSGRPEAVLTGQESAVLKQIAGNRSTGAGFGDGFAVHVWVGDQELRQIVRGEIRSADGDLVAALDAGRA